jgi:hypothetical protein
MVPGNSYESAEDFISKMDSGILDGRLSEEMKNLSTEQLEDVARVIMERKQRRSGDSA